MYRLLPTSLTIYLEDPFILSLQLVFGFAPAYCLISPRALSSISQTRLRNRALSRPVSWKHVNELYTDVRFFSF